MNNYVVVLDCACAIPTPFQPRPSFDQRGKLPMDSDHPSPLHVGHDSVEDSQQCLEKALSQEDPVTTSSGEVDSELPINEADTDVCQPEPPHKRVSRQERRRKEREERKWKGE